MPVVWVPDGEFKALQAVLGGKDEVDWDAYDRVKPYLLFPVPVPVEECLRVIATALATERAS